MDGGTPSGSHHPLQLDGTLPVIDRLGEEIIIYASDYPHWDCLYPESAKIILRNEGLSESSKRKLLRENALRLFGPRA